MAEVKLLNYTQDARELLIFTKSTRLNMQPELLQEIYGWTEERKRQELEYMANTIPSSWEFVDYVFLITGCSRAFTHQFVRTRTGSYAQQSMRVTDMGGYSYVPTAKTEQGKTIEGAVNDRIGDGYAAMLAAGEEIEDARGILPTNICTNICAKFDLRTLSDMCKSRTGGRTQAEYRDIIGLMATEVLMVHPWAEMFLFPKGRDYWKDLESAVMGVKDWKQRTEILKVIDKMRKS